MTSLDLDAEAPPTEAGRLDAFITYARQNGGTEFVDTLAAALTARGKSVWVDRMKIEAAAEWRVRIARGIESGARQRVPRPGSGIELAFDDERLAWIISHDPRSRADATASECCQRGGWQRLPQVLDRASASRSGNVGYPWSHLVTTSATPRVPRRAAAVPTIRPACHRSGDATEESGGSAYLSPYFG